MSDRPDPAAVPITRRVALAALAAAPTFAVGGARSAPAGTLPAGACVLTPEAIEGPFYFDPALVRSDIAEGLPGAPLTLTFALVDAATCAPLAGARLDIWHADADGRYSGYGNQGDARKSTRNATFLRGTQFTDGQGVARFRTVYPGWYPGRTPHVHLKAILDDREMLTTQVYFPDALTAEVYRQAAAYRPRAARQDTTNATDFLYARAANREAALLDVRENADVYAASITIAADRGAASKRWWSPR